MLLICSTFYCLSNIILLICFLFLSYKYVRGQMMIFYDQNEILDQIDKLLYGLCLASCIIISILMVFPNPYLIDLVKILKMMFELIILQTFLQLNEYNLHFPKVPRFINGVVVIIILLQFYYQYQQRGLICAKFSSLLLSLTIFGLSLLTTYLGINDIKQINVIFEERIVQSTKGLKKITFIQIKKRIIYITVLTAASIFSSLYLLIIQSQQFLRKTCVHDEIGIISQTIGNVFSYLMIFAIEPIAVYYLMVWRNYSYLIEKGAEEQFRISESQMIELESYRKL